MVTHIAPFNSRFSDEAEHQYSSLLGLYHVDLVIYGHAHKAKPVTEYYGDGVKYLGVGSIQKRNYFEINFLDDNIEVVRQHF